MQELNMVEVGEVSGGWIKAIIIEIVKELGKELARISEEAAHNKPDGGVLDPASRPGRE